MQLSVDQVTVRFPAMDRPVLDGVNFQARTGRSVAILGPSGSGKSTLLGVIGGLVKVNSGAVRFSDREIDWRPAHATSWILQTTNVAPERTALDNVVISGLLRGLNRRDAEQEARKLLGVVGLGHATHFRCGDMSGGEVQRVVIARALNAQRAFILADEPTGQLDSTTSDLIVSVLVQEVARRTALGLIIVTHDKAVADRCDRTVRIVDGKVIEPDE